MTIETGRLLALLRPVELAAALPDRFDEMTDDSREVTPGTLFFAIPGAVRDGHEFVGRLPAGATAVVERIIPGAAAAQLLVPSTRTAYFSALCAWFDLDPDTMTLTAVTGTNGKTTFTYLMESILSCAGRTPAVIGTVEYRCGDWRREAPNTTPGMRVLVETLRAFRERGATDVVMEVSSHALVQGRLGALAYDVAAFTNLTPEHLDYHAGMADYYDAKKKLFSEHLKPGGRAVVNVDDPYGRRLSNELPAGTVQTLSVAGDATYRGRIMAMTTAGLELSVTGPDLFETVSSRLAGRYNASNVLTAFAAARAAGIAPAAIVQGIAALPAVPGRLEDIPNGSGISAFVDYAHTPDALANVLKTLKELTRGRIIVVFGCGGDRDRTKRPVMGEIASAYSDVVIITSDNPRTEDALRIIDEIRAGVNHGKEAIVEPDRAAAIAMAVAKARSGDTILVAGKGHEDYQILGETKIPFSDRDVLSRALGGRS